MNYLRDLWQRFTEWLKRVNDQFKNDADGGRW